MNSNWRDFYMNTGDYINDGNWDEEWNEDLDCLHLKWKIQHRVFQPNVYYGNHSVFVYNIMITKMVKLSKDSYSAHTWGAMCRPIV